MAVKKKGATGYVKGASKAKGRMGPVKRPGPGKKGNPSFTKKAKPSKGKVDPSIPWDKHKEPVVNTNQADVALNKLIGDNGGENR